MSPGRLTRTALLAAAVAGVLLLLTPSVAAAYVGPGAGFAFITSFLAMFVSGLLALGSLLLWPFRVLIALIRGRRRPKARIRRLIIVGLDGQDPRLTDRFLREGKLANFERLARLGCYHPLQSTFPSVSPVAWSSFSTGTHPARHNIFDFLDRDRRTYLPVLSSAEMGKVSRVLRLGRFQLPLGRPALRLLRKSEPFWSILGRSRIWSTVLRVPITFPPDRFYGAQLSAMSVPDLLGTQGTFTLFTTRRTDGAFKEGGIRVAVTLEGDRIRSSLAGPGNPFVSGEPPLTLPLEIRVKRRAGTADVRLGTTRLELRPGELSDWTPVRFRAAPGIAAHGICRLLLTELDQHVSLYVTPINIDPERPAMPLSRPAYYARYLAKKLGPFATLGLAEDTWARNEGVIDDGTFLRLSYDIDRERQDMLFAALEKLRRGTLVCVFDATDRIQHMFWRYLEDGHPALATADNDGGGAEAGITTDAVPPEHRDAIERLYIHNDGLVGRVLDRLGKGDVLMVLSDHGFTSFRRGVNLNRWLLQHGYLALRPDADGSAEWLRDVDWSRTRAYALGLTGLFLNVKGREAQGIVEPGEEATALKTELIARLSGLVDDVTGVVAVREAFDPTKLYRGPYIENAPDLLVGYNHGYRVSWDCATGVVAGAIFEDNVKAWSGDHCVDPRLVPGVFFCNRPIHAADPALIDIAPTALWLFGVEPPAHMDGKVLFHDDA
jgi:predicted AlkP superfamily phosphohydrolase/phosphomutase